MRRGLWSAVAGMVAACGMASLSAWSLPTAVVGWVLLNVVVISFWACLLPDDAPVRWRVLIGRSLPWPTTVLAGAGLLLALGWTNAVLLIAAGLVAASEAGWLGGQPRSEPRKKGRPAAGRWRRSRAAEGDAVGEVAIRLRVVDPAEAVLEVTDELSDSDLCMAWRSSYVALDRAAGPSQKLRAVQIRELLLDELERRDAPGLEAWFRSGARAAGGPDRYLRRIHPRPAGDTN